MTKALRILSLLLLICIAISSLVSCDLFNTKVDYAGQVKLDLNSGRLTQEVTVKQFVDGDTTHFNVPESIRENGVLKARYLAINTPESTGAIEEWGKSASKYTRSKLENAVSIIIESDTDKWNADSTGERFLVWVWYKTADMEDYRNLNIEILQEGLAIASNSAQNSYGDICMNAIQQAQKLKLYVYSGEKDPDFFYDQPIPVTLRDLACNIEIYEGAKVAFEGIVTKDDGGSIYVEDYCEETGMYHGITCYKGYALNGMGLNVITVGNRVTIVGSVQYYEAGGTWQISDLKYDMMNPNDPMSLKFISSGHSAAFVPTTAETFLSTVTLNIIDEDGEQIDRDFAYAKLALNTSISMSNLKVVKIYTTNNGGDSNGAMTLTCEVDGKTIEVRTTVLRDANGKIITADDFKGKTIDVKGIVDYYDGGYQILVVSINDINIH